MENTNINTPTVTVKEVIEELTQLYYLTIKQSISFKTLPTPFLWGAPGVGKSDCVKQIAEKLELLTRKKAIVTDVRLLLFSPVDIRGVPMANAEKEVAVWLKPQIFDMDESEEVINILLLDELSAAPQSVQAAAYQICLDRKVGEHSLPGNCIVIAAGNRTTDRSVAYKMPKALCNRLMHFCVESSVDSWKKWAVENRIDERIIGYLSFDNSKLCIDPGNSDLAYPTPRSWEKTSNILKAFDGKIPNCRNLLRANIGADTAIEFENWCRVYKDLPRVEDILNGRCNDYPNTHDALYALITGLFVAVNREKDELLDSTLENVCRYASRFPKDFATMFFKDLIEISEMRSRMMKCSSFNYWLAKNRSFV